MNRMDLKAKKRKSDDRVMAASSPGMATGNSADRHPASPDDAVFAEGLDGIPGAGWCEPAFRSQPGRDNPLIDLNKGNQG